MKYTTYDVVSDNDNYIARDAAEECNRILGDAGLNTVRSDAPRDEHLSAREAAESEAATVTAFCDLHVAVTEYDLDEDTP